MQWWKREGLGGKDWEKQAKELKLLNDMDNKQRRANTPTIGVPEEKNSGRKNNFRCNSGKHSIKDVLHNKQTYIPETTRWSYITNIPKLRTNHLGT